ncbi:hypothetical protein ACFVX3_28955, partial [Rhodococcus erythropolis]
MRPEWRIADNSLSKTKNPDLHRHADRGLNSSVGAEGFEPYSIDSICAAQLSTNGCDQHRYAM